MAHLRALVVFDAHKAGQSAALRFGFERDGYTVHAPSTMADALAVASTAMAQLVVVVLPGASDLDDDADRARAIGVGYSLVARLREEPQTRQLPIVVLGDRGEREQALRAGADEFVARPAFIRDVITLSKLAVAARQDGDEGGVVGTLDDYQLYFLTRALAAAERSCVLELERGRRSGEVCFNKGQVCAARVGAGTSAMAGVAAFNHLLLWSEASMNLRFESPASVAPDRKISVGVDELLAAGAKFAREFEALADRIGGAAAIYRQEPRKAASERNKIPPEVLQLLKIYDGRRPLIDVVEDSPFKPNDTIKITHRLHEMGVLKRLSAPVTTSPLTAALAVRDWLLGGADGSHPTVEERSTVTEAGRRAAEAYAEEAARRAAAKSPGDDLLGERDRAGVPKPIEDVPTAPREGQRGPQARNKKRKRRGDTGKVQKAPAAAPPPVPPSVTAAPSTANGAHATHKPADVDDELTTPFMREPIETAPPVDNNAPAAKTAPAAPPVERLSHPVPATAPKGATGATVRDKDPKPAAARAAVTGPVTKAPPLKEVAFTAEEEDFFARESELAKAEIDTFDDLEPSRPQAPVKRRWFGLGPKFVAPASKPAPPKKR
jgi:CheY-like chemotaxis protein